jgi:hypothetical protein
MLPLAPTTKLSGPFARISRSKDTFSICNEWSCSECHQSIGGSAPLWLTFPGHMLGYLVEHRLIPMQVHYPNPHVAPRHPRAGLVSNVGAFFGLTSPTLGLILAELVWVLELAVIAHCLGPMLSWVALGVGFG